MAYLEMCRDRTQLPTKINPHKNTIRLFFKPLPDPGLLISMIIGDAVHNMRSALDHLWKRLGGTGNFPLFADLDGPNNWNTHKTARLAPIHPNAHAIIDALQPCHEGQRAPSHPLAILNKLSNIDKHEAIHVTLPRSRDTRFEFRDRATQNVALVIRPPVVFHDETEVLIKDVPEGVVQPGMNVNIKGTLFVAFKETGPWELKPVQEVLVRCLDFIKHSVVEPLAPFTK